MFIWNKNNKLNVVAVDGFRLAWKSKFLQSKTNDFTVVIPGRTLNEINKIILDSYDNIKIGIEKKSSIIRNGKLQNSYTSIRWRIFKL